MVAVTICNLHYCLLLGDFSPPPSPLHLLSSGPKQGTYLPERVSFTQERSKGVLLFHNVLKTV